MAMAMAMAIGNGKNECREKMSMCVLFELRALSSARWRAFPRGTTLDKSRTRGRLRATYILILSMRVLHDESGSDYFEVQYCMYLSL